MNSNIIKICFGLLAILILGVFLYMDEIDKGEKLEVEKESKKLFEKIKESKKEEDREIAFLDSMNLEEVGYLEKPLDKDIVKSFRDSKNMIQFVFGSVMLNKVDYFKSSFLYDTLSSDLHEVENSDKEEVLKDMIKRISRNGKLKQVIFLKEKIHVKGSTVDIRLEYKDGKKAKITLELELAKNFEAENSEILYVRTSVWDIINTIEKEVEK